MGHALAQGQGFTGAEFKRQAEDKLLRGIVLGYVRGTLDADRWAYQYTLLIRQAGKSQEPIPLICPPGGATTEQALEIVLKYLRERPERWHEPAESAVRHSLLLVWSCPIK